MKRSACVCALVTQIFLAGMTAALSPCWAQEGTAGDYMADIGIKFGRGLLNIISAPAEIPCAVSDDLSNNKAAGFFTGFSKGAVLMLRRVLIGVTEVGTFLIPMERTIHPVCKEPAHRI